MGVATVSIPVKEEHSDSIRSVSISVKDLENDEWELSSITIAVKAYTDSSSVFTSEALQESKPKLRHYLLDITMFHMLLKLLIDMI